MAPDVGTGACPSSSSSDSSSSISANSADHEGIGGTFRREVRLTSQSRGWGAPDAGSSPEALGSQRLGHQGRGNPEDGEHHRQRRGHVHPGAIRTRFRPRDEDPRGEFPIYSVECNLKRNF